MGGEGVARRLAADEPLDRRRAPGRSSLDRELVLGRVRQKLVDQTRLALRAPAVKRAPELLDHEGRRSDARLGIRRLGPGRCKRCLERFDVERAPAGHGWKEITSAVSQQRLSGPPGSPYGSSARSRRPPASTISIRPVSGGTSATTSRHGGHRHRARLAGWSRTDHHRHQPAGFGDGDGGLYLRSPHRTFPHHPTSAIVSIKAFVCTPTGCVSRRGVGALAVTGSCG